MFLTKFLVYPALQSANSFLPDWFSGSCLQRRLKHRFSLQHGYHSNPTTPKHQHTSNQEHTTNVVIQQHSRKLLMMDILIFETRWAHKKWSKTVSTIKLVFLFSTIFETVQSYRCKVLWRIFVKWQGRMGPPGLSSLSVQAYRFSVTSLGLWFYFVVCLHVILRDWKQVNWNAVKPTLEEVEGLYLSLK